MTMGQGAIQSVSRKQKVNMRGSTEAELVAIYDASVYVSCAVLFI